MLVKEVEYYNNGNPNRKFQEDDRRKYDELKKAKRNRERRKRAASKFKRKIAFQIIAMCFITGILILAIDAKVFTMQQQVTDIDKNIETAKQHNEDLRVNLLKTGSLNDIENGARNKLGMIPVTKDNVAQIDLSNNYFQVLDQEDKDKSEQKENYLDKITSMFN